MNYEEILRKIIRKYGVMTENIRTAQLIESKLAKRTATYADAEKFAQDIGGILTDVFREYLPEALTDGRLYRAAAEVLVQKPMVVAGNDVADVAIRIQQELNENAGIGMNAIDPGLNQDQIDGIITGICNAESYDSSVELFMDQVAGFFEGEVDDFVRENADFQYKAGLSPTIERKISGKCCAWCAKLAGTYPYDDVKDRGNDVFRRHNNCHCQILYNPADGSKKRQNVRNRQWTDEGKADRIAFATAGTEKPDLDEAARADLDKTKWEKVNPNRLQRIQGGFSAFPEGDVLNEYIKNVKPEKGYFDVAMHGSTDAVGFGTEKENMKARDLARIIRRDEQYTGGPVRLLCCDTGRKVGDEYCFAEELANALGQPVKAPEDVITFFKDGSYIIGNNNEVGFHEYIPNERRRLR